MARVGEERRGGARKAAARAGRQGVFGAGQDVAGREDAKRPSIREIYERIDGRPRADVAVPPLDGAVGNPAFLLAHASRTCYDESVKSKSPQGNGLALVGRL